jgi:hypothetical protein
VFESPEKFAAAFVYENSVALVTLTDTLQDDGPALSVPFVRLTALAVVLAVPPQVFVSADGEATARPLGRVSVKSILPTPALPAGFETVMVRTDTPPTCTTAGTNTLATCVGAGIGAQAVALTEPPVTFNVALFSKPVLVALPVVKEQSAATAL